MDFFGKLKQLARKRFPKSLSARLDRVRANLIGTLFPFDLTKMSKYYGTDKGNFHHYTVHYQSHFRNYKYHKINLLEIGVGGYDRPNEGGNSLRMWKKYFPFGRIYSMDIFDKTSIQEDRITIFQGSQNDTEFLEMVVKEIGCLDIIIDDGSHRNQDVITTFEFLFPHLKDGGLYVIEDTETSYRNDMGGDSKDLLIPTSTINYFKTLVDRINHVEFRTETYINMDYDNSLYAIHFYHNLIFINKNNSNEESSNFRPK